jgi:hypothetical protein
LTIGSISIGATGTGVTVAVGTRVAVGGTGAAVGLGLLLHAITTAINAAIARNVTDFW